jgi:nitrogen fixation NifU-like protein
LEIDVIERAETNDLDHWVAALQEAILEREQAMFSAKVLEEARQPQNMGVMDDPDGYGLEFGSCGDTMEIFLRIDGERIENATFMTNGCGPTVASGSMMTRLAHGTSLEDAAAIDAAEIVTALDGLPAEHIHCATLAAAALHHAIADCLSEGKVRGE